MNRKLSKIIIAKLEEQTIYTEANRLFKGICKAFKNWNIKKTKYIYFEKNIMSAVEKIDVVLNPRFKH